MSFSELKYVRSQINTHLWYITKILKMKQDLTNN